MTFITSIFLWFIPLASIPFIFHLLKKKRYTILKFSSLRFLREMEKDSINKLNIINILLLIIRTFIILFLLLLLSRPVINTKYSRQGVDSSKIVLLYIDNSYSNSTQLKNNVQSLLDTLIDTYDRNTQFKVLQLSDNKILYENNSKNINHLINQVEISYSPNSINLINLDNLSISNDFYASKDIYILTDLQTSTFSNISESLISTLNDWNIFIVTHQTINNNIYIQNLKFVNDFIIVDEIFELKANVNNVNYTNENIEIELNIDNINVGKNIIKVNPNKSNTITFQSTIPEKKLYKGQMKIVEANDRIDDNQFYFSIYPDLNNNICIVSNDDNSYYFNKALKAQELLTNSFNIYNYTLDEYLFNNLTYYDSVILFDYSQLTEDVFNKISSQTSNLILIPTDYKIDNVYLNKLLNINTYSNLEFIHVNDSSSISLNENLLNSKELKELFMSNKGNRTIEFYTYPKIPISSNTIISYSNGYSFLDQYSTKNLNIYTIHSFMNLKNTNFPIKGTYIPFINFLTQTTTTKNYYYSGYKYQNLNKFNYTHIKPSNDTILGSKKILKLNEPGHHKISYENNTDYISINIDTLEYYDSLISSDQLLTILPNVLIIDENKDISKIIRDIVTGYELWRYFLYAIIILVILEMYLSNYYYYSKND